MIACVVFLGIALLGGMMSFQDHISHHPVVANFTCSPSPGVFQEGDFVKHNHDYELVLMDLGPIFGRVASVQQRKDSQLVDVILFKNGEHLQVDSHWLDRLSCSQN